MGRVILALDLATTTGWAIGPIGHRCLSGSIRFAQNKAPRALILKGAMCWLKNIICQNKPDIICFESPIPMFGKTNFNTLRILYGLAGITEAVSYDSNLNRVTDISVSSVRKFILGRCPKGKQAKLDTIKAIEAHGYTPKDDNEADAIALWIYATHQFEEGQ